MELALNVKIVEETFLINRRWTIALNYYLRDWNGTTITRHCEGGLLESNLNQFQKILDPNYTDGYFILF